MQFMLKTHARVFLCSLPPFSTHTHMHAELHVQITHEKTGPFQYSRKKYVLSSYVEQTTL